MVIYAGTTAANATAAGVDAGAVTGVVAGTTSATAAASGVDSGAGTSPIAPSNCNASADSDSQITVSWTDNSTNEDNFRVQRSQDQSSWSTVATPVANTTSIQDSGLSQETTYYYRVRAENSYGNSGYSNTASATTQSTPPVIAGTTIATTTATGVDAGSLTVAPVVAGTTPASASASATDAGSVTGTLAGTTIATSTASATDAGALRVTSMSTDREKFVNDGRRAVRDAWGDKPNPTISTLAVGSDNSNLSRSNSSLNNQTNSASVSVSLVDDTTVEFEATITQSNVGEVGLLTSGGDLVARGVFDSPVDVNGRVSVTLSIRNDDSVSRGVLTDAGQTAVRDVLADNSPSTPTDYAYGSDGSSVSESDTALGNELVSVSLSSVEVQDASTQADWTAVAGDIPAQTPLAVFDTSTPLNPSAGALGTTQTCFTTEGENYTTGDTGTVNGPADSSEFSNGDYAALSVSGHSVTYEFTLLHEVPANQFEAPIRFASSTTSGGTAATDWIVRGPSGELASGQFVADGSTFTSPVWGTEIPTSEFPNALPPGTYELELDCVTTATALNDQTTFIDVVAPRDARYSVTLDDTVDANGYLSGPEQYPSLVEYELTEAVTRRNVTSASFTSSWNSTANEQFVELANDGSTYTRFDNSSSGSASFASGEAGVNTRLGFGRYSASNQQTPTSGNTGQRIESWSLDANPAAVVPDDIGEAVTRGIVPPGTITGDTVREAGLKNGSTLLSRHEIAEFDVLAGQRVSSSERTEFSGDN